MLTCFIFLQGEQWLHSVAEAEMCDMGQVIEVLHHGL